jgi:hypothetical protein
LRYRGMMIFSSSLKCCVEMKMECASTPHLVNMLLFYQPMTETLPQAV